MDEDRKIARCPFCSGIHFHVARKKTAEGVEHRVRCDNCTALGPPASDLMGSIAKWNERTVYDPATAYDIKPLDP